MHRRERMLWLGTAAVLAAYLWINVVGLLPRIDASLSDFSFYHDVAARVGRGESPFMLPNFYYPPLVALLLAPMGLLPLATARLLWFVCNHLFIALAGLWVWRRLGGGAGAALVVASVWTLSGTVRETLWQGQIDAALLLLVALAMWPPRESRRWRAAAIGLATALKLWPGILLAGPGLARRWRQVAGGAAAAGLLLAGSFAATAALTSGPHAPSRTRCWMGTPAALNTSVPAVVLRLLDRPGRSGRLPEQWFAGHNTETARLSNLQAAVSLACAAGLLAAGLVLLWRATRSDPSLAGGALGLAALISLALAASPLAWPHYHLLQLPGAALLAAGYVRRRAWPRLFGLGAVLAVLGWTFWITVGPYQARYGLGTGNLPLLWLLSSQIAVANLLLFAAYLGELVRASEGAHRPSGARAPGLPGPRAPRRRPAAR